jgi:hypothetical protein
MQVLFCLRFFSTPPPSPPPAWRYILKTISRQPNCLVQVEPIGSAAMQHCTSRYWPAVSQHKGPHTTNQTSLTFVADRC